MNVKKGGYIIFIAFDEAVKKYEILGYFVVDHTYVDNDSWRAKKWGQYTVVADPAFSKRIRNLYLNNLLGEFDRKFIDKFGRLSIGIATQGPSYLSNHDLKIIIDKANTFTDDELMAVHQKLVKDKAIIFAHANNFKRKNRILEENLEDFTIDQISQLEDGLKVIGRQVATSAGRIDILCQDKDDNFVVVELKRGRISDQVVGQLSRYMGWVKENKAHDSKKVRGIIVASEADKNLDYALKANSQMELKTFALSFK